MITRCASCQAKMGNGFGHRTPSVVDPTLCRDCELSAAVAANKKAQLDPIESAKRAEAESRRAEEAALLAENRANYERLREQADSLAKEVHVSTLPDIHGRQIIGHLGIARGGTVRAKNAISDFGAGLKNIVGGEMKAYTELLAHAREEALHRMKVDAVMLGADAVVGVNFSTSMIDVGAAEITAFGTAVKLAEVTADE
jgi:uncharacterized protein YbjQ (UPF0145 family)